MSDININGLRSFLKELYDSDTAAFRFHAHGEITLLSTCFGVQTAYLIKALNDFDRLRLVDTIRRCQEDNGLFRDKSFSSADLVGQQEETYLLWQFTFFSLLALESLGNKPQQFLHFMLPFMEEKYLRIWFETRKWENFWYCSNEIMFLMFFFVYMRDRIGRDTVKITNCLRWCLEELDSRQDSDTGFWGIGVCNDPLNGLYGAAHVVGFYDYLGHKLKHAGSMVQTTLCLQSAKSGLFGEKWGGACEDYDGVEVLLHASRQIKDISKVQKALSRIMYEIIEGVDSSGGYPYSLTGKGLRGIWNRMMIRLRGQDSYYYSGWKRMHSSIFKPDLWGTYFRTLAVAQISCLLDPILVSRWNFLTLPGWGYRMQIEQS
jgi:hypothetical protein